MLAQGRVAVLDGDVRDAPVPPLRVLDPLAQLPVVVVRGDDRQALALQRHIRDDLAVVGRVVAHRDLVRAVVAVGCLRDAGADARVGDVLGNLEEALVLCRRDSDGAAERHIAAQRRHGGDAERAGALVRDVRADARLLQRCGDIGVAPRLHALRADAVAQARIARIHRRIHQAHVAVGPFLAGNRLRACAKQQQQRNIPVSHAGRVGESSLNSFRPGGPP